MNALQRLWNLISGLFAFFASLPGWITAGATAIFVAIGGSVLAFNYFMHTWPMDYALDRVQELRVRADAD